MDAQLQELLRQWRAEPHDAALAQRAAAACRRSGSGVPADLVDALIEPARTFRSERKYAVCAELQGSVYHQTSGTPGEVELPEHRVWWVHPTSGELDAEAAQELCEAEVPGVSIGRKKTGPLIEALSQLPHLRWLSLSGSGANDDKLEAFPELPNLAELNLTGCRKMTADGLAGVLARAPNVVRLTLDNDKQVKDLACLAEVNLLRRLSMHRAGLSLKLARSLPELPELSHLHISGNKLTLKLLGLLHEKLPGLRELTVEVADGIESSFLDALSAFEHLTALTVVDTVITVPDLSALAKLPLRYLDVSLAAVEDPGALGQLTELTHLALNVPSDAALRALEGLPNLRRLHLVCRPADPLPAFDVIARSPRLEELSLRGTNFQAPLEDALMALSGSGLRTLRLDSLWYEGQERVAPAPQLDGVEVRCERISIPPRAPGASGPCGPWADLS